jgi:tRNA 2-thiocytidine biosynthesis protein TtcA
LISQWSDHVQYPIIPCNLCGSQDNLQRQVIKEMLVGWDESNPGRVENIARSVNSVTLSHLGDRRHYDFEGLVAENRGVEAIEVEKRRIDITEVR